LKDQIPISQEAYQRADGLRAEVRALIDGRQEFLRRTGRSPEIHLPQGIWKLGRKLYDACKVVMDGDYAIINNLRLFAQIFTDFQLITLSRGAGLPIPTAIPPDLDERLSVLARSPGPCMDAYLRTIAHLPDALHLTPPNVFGEVGWLSDGKIINDDTNACVERVALLAECGKLWELRNRTPARAALPGNRWQRPRILEIGAGHGGLAYQLMKLIPDARYIVLDIPEALLFASIYLSTLWAEKDNVFITPANVGDLGKDSAGFTFVPNFLFDECAAAGLEFDLVINTLSMSEMSERQIVYYCEGIKCLLGPRGVFFEQNQDNRPVGMLDAKLLIAQCMPLCLPLRSFAVPVTRGQPHLWAVAPVEPYQWCPSADISWDGLPDPSARGRFDEAWGRPRLIEEGYWGVNIIYYRGGWYGLPQGSGPFDPFRAASKDYPRLFTADSRDHLKSAIRCERAWS
jgi:hypothetical protein